MKKLLVVVVVACGFAAFANEWYIDPTNGVDTAAGTKEAPRRTLKGAMEIHDLAENDTVWLLPGDYNVGEMPYFDETVKAMTYASTNRCFITKPGLKIRSTGGKDVTFVTGEKYQDADKFNVAYGGTRCFLIAAEATGVVIEGLTIRTGYAPYVQAVPYSYGGGVLDRSKSCWVVDCKFSGGRASRGGGQTYGNALRTEYIDTGAEARGTAVQDVNMLVNCAIRNTGGAAPVDGGTPTLVNCLITATKSKNAISQDATITAYNSIFVGNPTGGNGTKKPSTFWNCVVGPFIVGANTNDNVTCVSCVTNATVNDVAWASTTSPYDWRIASTSVARGVGDTAILATIQEQLPEGYSVYTDLYGTPIPEEGKIAAGPVQPVNWYVDAANGNDDDYEGKMQAAAFKTIKKATSVAYDGDTIRVAPGVYGEAEGTQLVDSKAVVPTRVILPENITLESLEGAEKTFIVGKGPDTTDDTYGFMGLGSVKCVYAPAGSVIRGFTITGGHTVSLNPGVTADKSYSAVHGATSTLVENCIVSNNFGCSDSICNATVRNSKILNNVACDSTGKAGYGAAGTVCAWEGCLFDGNRGDRQLYNSRAPIVNCTIGANNRPNADGSGSNAGIVGCNSKTYIPRQMLVNTLWVAGKHWISSTAGVGATVATNCIIQSGIIGTAGGIAFANCVNCITNITTTNIKKSVVDTDYRLIENSPAIDAGTNDLVNLARDLDGNPRISNGTVDIGAYEYDWRGRYKEDLGPRVTAVTAASPEVVETEDGTVRIPSGTLVGTFKPGALQLNFTLKGGTLELYLGGELVETFEATDAVELSKEIWPSDENNAFRLAFTPNAVDGYAEIARLKKGTSGIIFIVR